MFKYNNLEYFDVISRGRKSIGAERNDGIARAAGAQPRELNVTQDS